MSNPSSACHRVLSALRGRFGPFYLTGGAALSLFYLPGRPCTDIDLVAYKEPDFQVASEKIIRLLVQEFSVSPDQIRRFRNFVRMTIPGSPPVNVELINDFDEMWGEPVIVDWIPLDAASNILVNKLNCMMERDNPRDLDDIAGLASAYSFSMPEVIRRVRRKSMIAQAFILDVMIRKSEGLFKIIGNREPINFAAVAGIPLPLHFNYLVVSVEFTAQGDGEGKQDCSRVPLSTIIMEISALATELRALALKIDENAKSDELPLMLCYEWGGCTISIKRRALISEEAIHEACRSVSGGHANPGRPVK